MDKSKQTDEKKIQDLIQYVKSEQLKIDKQKMELKKELNFLSQLRQNGINNFEDVKKIAQGNKEGGGDSSLMELKKMQAHIEELEKKVSSQEQRSVLQSEVSNFASVLSANKDSYPMLSNLDDGDYRENLLKQAMLYRKNIAEAEGEEGSYEKSLKILEQEIGTFYKNLAKSAKKSKGKDDEDPFFKEEEEENEEIPFKESEEEEEVAPKKKKMGEFQDLIEEPFAQRQNMDKFKLPDSSPASEQAKINDIANKYGYSIRDKR